MSTEPEVIEIEGEETLEYTDGSRDAIALWGRQINYAAPSDGDVLTWNDTEEYWEPASLTAALDDRYLNAAGDTVTGDLETQDVFPDDDGTRNLGTALRRWNGFWAAAATIGALVVGPISPSSASADIGSVGDEFRTIYVDDVVATTLSGDLPWTEISDTPTSLAGYGILDGATVSALAQVAADLSSHEALTNNPHGVTKDQVGLGDVENTTLSTWGGSSNITTVGTLTGLVVSGALTYSSARFDIWADTLDAADNKAITISGGGALSTIRGAYLILGGNEDASYPGQAIIRGGDSAGVIIGGGTTFVEQGLTVSATINSSGNVTLTGATSKFSVDGNTSSTDTAFRTKVSGDSVYRMTIAADGALSLGSGSASTDVTIFRGAAHRLDLGSGVSLKLSGGDLFVDIDDEIGVDASNNLRWASSYGTILSGAGQIIFLADTNNNSVGWGFRWGIDAGNPGTATVLMSLHENGDLYLGTGSEPASGSGKVMVFGNNGANPTLGNNSAGIYAKDVSGTVEMFAADEAGNATQISPHDPLTGEWYFYSENRRRNRSLRVNIEQFIRDAILALGMDETRYIIEQELAA